MGEFFFPGCPHTNNFNVKMQHDTGKWVISINCDLSLPKTLSLLNSLTSL